jgi:hypothetical protein
VTLRTSKGDPGSLGQLSYRRKSSQATPRDRRRSHPASNIVCPIDALAPDGHRGGHRIAMMVQATIAKQARIIRMRFRFLVIA